MPQQTKGDNSGVSTSPSAVNARAERSCAVTVSRSSQVPCRLCNVFFQEYYTLAKERKNLTVLLGSHATRVLFAEGDGDLVASGVEYSKGGLLESVSASKEVILCAGSFQTPQLLELSGMATH